MHLVKNIASRNVQNWFSLGLCFSYYFSFYSAVLFECVLGIEIISPLVYCGYSPTSHSGLVISISSLSWCVCGCKFRSCTRFEWILNCLCVRMWTKRVWHYTIVKVALHVSIVLVAYLDLKPRIDADGLKKSERQSSLWRLATNTKQVFKVVLPAQSTFKDVF